MPSTGGMRCHANGLRNQRRNQEMAEAFNDPTHLENMRQSALWARFVAEFKRPASIAEAVRYYEGGSIGD